MIDKSVGTSGLLHEAHFVPWNPAFIRKLLISLVRKKIGLFAIYPEVGTEDLLQVAELAMTNAWPKWNPSRAALSTYLYKAGSNAIISLWREAEKKHQEAKTRTHANADGEDPADLLPASLEQVAATLSAVEWDRNESVRDWLCRIHAAVKKMPDTRRRRRYTLAQAVCISLLMRRLKLGYKGVREVLHQQEDFRDAIGLRQVPSHGSIQTIAGEFLRNR